MSEFQSSDPDAPTPVPFFDLTEQFRSIQGDVQEAVERVLTSQQFVLGDEVAEFECDLAEYCDSRDAIGCASGTDALILSLMALDIGPGDEVITTPFSFFATASAITRVGATPVFVDIDPVSYNFDVEAVEAAITPQTRAIMPVHLFGQCAEMEPLWRLAARHGIAIVEDACQAIGASYRGRRAGVLGTLGCFSFFPTKNLGGAGDGGIITTDDPVLAQRLRRLRVHGDQGGYTHTEVGLNSRLDALQAAVLSVKLRHLDAWANARRTNAAVYDLLIGGSGLVGDVVLPHAKADRIHVYNQYCVRIPNGRRDDVLKSLRAQQIGCAVYYPKPLHLQECFADLGYQLGEFPVAEQAADEVLALPVYPELGAERVEQVVNGLEKAVAEAGGRSLRIAPGTGVEQADRRAA